MFKNFVEWIVVKGFPFVSACIEPQLVAHATMLLFSTIQHAVIDARSNAHALGGFVALLSFNF
jgi:hypothetical protein